MGGGTDFQASQCIPMRSNLTLDAAVAADGWCGYTLNLSDVVILHNRSISIECCLLTTINIVVQMPILAAKI